MTQAGDWTPEREELRCGMRAIESLVPVKDEYAAPHHLTANRKRLVLEALAAAVAALPSGPGSEPVAFQLKINSGYTPMIYASEALMQKMCRDYDLDFPNFAPHTYRPLYAHPVPASQGTTRPTRASVEALTRWYNDGDGIMASIAAGDPLAGIAEYLDRDAVLALWDTPEDK